MEKLIPRKACLPSMQLEAGWNRRAITRVASSMHSSAEARMVMLFIVFFKLRRPISYYFSVKCTASVIHFLIMSRKQQNQGKEERESNKGRTNKIADPLPRGEQAPSPKTHPVQVTSRQQGVDVRAYVTQFASILFPQSSSKSATATDIDTWRSSD